jgi:hypothetical protein
MTRAKRRQSSADVDAEIRRLQAERQRLIDAEDQRRGALIREYLSAPSGGALRAALGPLVSRRDATLFRLETEPSSPANVTDRRPRPRPARAASVGDATAPAGG